MTKQENLEIKKAPEELTEQDLEKVAGSRSAVDCGEETMFCPRNCGAKSR